jgi:hypothetical protein
LKSDELFYFCLAYRVYWVIACYLLSLLRTISDSTIMAQLDLLPACLLAKSASDGLSGGLYQRHNRQIFKSGRINAWERLRAARGKELGQAIGWEACSNMRKVRSTGARFRLL